MSGVQKTGALVFREWCPKDRSSGVCSMSGVQKIGALVFHEWCPKDSCWMTALKCCCVLHRYVAIIVSYVDLLCITAAIHLPEKDTSPPKTMCGCACGGITKNVTTLSPFAIQLSVYNCAYRVPLPPSLRPHHQHHHHHHSSVQLGNSTTTWVKHWSLL